MNPDFARDGYLHARAVFDATLIAELEEDFDRVVAQLSSSGEPIDATWAGAETQRLKRAGDTVLHTHNVHQYSGRWMHALLHRPFLDLCEELLGPDIVLHHTKLFCKPAGTGSPFPVHQDWSYFPTLHDSMIAAVIHVTDATDEMGCLRVHPGSHRLGRAERTSGQEASAQLDEWPLERAIPVQAEAGDVVFFHYFTLHGSRPNRSARTRKTVLAQLHSGDDRVEEDGPHPNERIVLRGWNRHATRERAGWPKT
ncbi:MAG: phytanoyl-CoA dioxygenase family protein [bacterium]|nr:phytanoyl-CoA dioxygenase family protein [bacterium]